MGSRRLAAGDLTPYSIEAGRAAAMTDTGDPALCRALLAHRRDPPALPLFRRHCASRRQAKNALHYQDCRECHGANLMGGVQGQLGPIGPGLTLVKDWRLEEFISTMRTGTDPAGHELGKQMPWQPIGKMDDEELTAIYQYLIHLPGS
jgi:mono/diheme cytochrome c family protein